MSATISTAMALACNGKFVSSEKTKKKNSLKEKLGGPTYLLSLRELKLQKLFAAKSEHALDLSPVSCVICVLAVLSLILPIEFSNVIAPTNLICCRMFLLTS